MLKIISINNTGDIKSEHVLLKAEADCNVGDYLLTDSTYGSNETPSNKLRHVFFFPILTVKKGDYVVLWTNPGNYTVGKMSNMAPQHNIHWGLQETVWNVKGDKAFLFTAPRAQRSSFTVAPKK
ncbi:hypothetical protein [Massilia timonae]|uniref:Uncharacterized protein n=1 Tax=Massilia timonae TaxID=47229 RepID=A0A1S2N7L5_9BURK|nr:hypothetical protein [Massilia timonae]OIJ41045.1 hypothetical protein LO55_1271 [Massilia timonae]